MNGSVSTLVLLSIVAVGILANACGDPRPTAPPVVPEAVGGGSAAADEGAERAQDAPPKADPWVRKRPFLSFLIVGNQRGKLKPCGCSEPQLGGLERLAVLTEMSKRWAGEGFSAVSLGWTLADRGEPQEATKATLYRAALERMGFDAHLLGTTDLHSAAMAQPFVEGATHDVPRPPANVPIAKGGPLRVAATTEPFVVWTVRGQTVRAQTIIDPGAISRVRDVAETALGPAGALQRLTPAEDTLWIVGTDATGAAMEELRTAMQRLGPTVIVDMTGAFGRDRIDGANLDAPVVVTLGNLGKEVGALDVDRGEGGKGWVVSYRLVPLAPALEQAPSDLRGEVSELFDVYRREVRERRYLSEFPTFPNDAAVRYVGSATCARCHPAVYQSWLGTAHAGALRTLKEQDYQEDPECVRCHVVGFERFPDGRWGRVEGGFLEPKRTPHLGGVGCECCHGPGEAHVESPMDGSLFGEGGPNRRHPGKLGCAVCHDVENSHGFEDGYESTYLPLVDHREVPSDRIYVERDDD